MLARIRLDPGQPRRGVVEYVRQFYVGPGIYEPSVAYPIFGFLAVVVGLSSGALAAGVVVLRSGWRGRSGLGKALLLGAPPFACGAFVLPVAVVTLVISLQVDDPVILAEVASPSGRASAVAFGFSAGAWDRTVFEVRVREIRPERSISSCRGPATGWVWRSTAMPIDLWWLSDEELVVAVSDNPSDRGATMETRDIGCTSVRTHEIKAPPGERPFW